MPDRLLDEASDGLLTEAGESLLLEFSGLIPVREKPPLRLSHDIETPSGKHYRWGEDEPRAENIPSNVRFGDTMPGGFETGEAVLPRKSEIVYSDLERLSTWTIYGPGGEIAWQGRLERAPRTSGDQMAVSPSAVGWQAHLEDDKSAREVYVGRDLTLLQEQSTQRKLNLIGLGIDAASGSWSVTPDETTGNPSLVFQIDRLTTPPEERLEAWWYAGGIEIGAVYLGFTPRAGIAADVTWHQQLVASSDDIATAFDALFDADGATVAAGWYIVPAGRRYLDIVFAYGGGAAADGPYIGQFSPLIVYGRSNVPLHGTDPFGGVWASDVVADAVARWAPQLVVNSDSIQPSSFVIPHLTFLEPTTAGEIIRQVTRFGLQDWAVWDNREFVWHERGTKGRSWRARIGPSQLEETGPAVDRLWESIMVQYQDVDGSTRIVGPPGSGADTEDAVLKDDDPENPANKLGIVKRDLLQMGVGTAASATEIGRQFLLRAKEFDRSGRARLVGHVEDDRGVLHPYWRVRAGDTISFVDAADTSARRIVKTDKSHSERSCSVELDAPPDALQALLERLGVVLVQFGL